MRDAEQALPAHAGERRAHARPPEELEGSSDVADGSSEVLMRDPHPDDSERLYRRLGGAARLHQDRWRPLLGGLAGAQGMVAGDLTIERTRLPKSAAR